MYSTKMETEMVIDHETDNVSVKELKIDVNGYENRPLEEEMMGKYNEKRPFKYKRGAGSWKKRLWYSIFEDMYEKLIYWRLVV